MTTQGDFTVTINATPDVVWTWVGDLSKHAQFSPRDYTVECVSGEPNTLGSRYRSVGWIPGDKAHKNDVEITEIVPDSRLVMLAHEEQGDFTNTFTLTPVGEGTKVDFRIVFPKMTGMSAVLVPVLFPLVGKSDIRKRMSLLKSAVESGA
ncbi:MAG: SRPBCC family protein [Actinomycetes bacterium]